MQLAPIVLFVYNRPWHTKQTIEALQKNDLAKASELFIYSDDAQNDNALKNVNEVRSYIENVNGFKKVTIIKRDTNWGLAKSIIDGVTNIVNKYGKIIVLEDDLVTSPYFLKFMNEALEFYKDENKVWHISGWTYPVWNDDKQDIFLWRGMNCWGWATWKNRWQYFEKNIDEILNDFTKDDIKAFNLDGTENFFAQVKENKKKNMNTWAVFWYATIFKNKALCLNPTKTFVHNIGHDYSGIHSGGNNDIYQSEISLQTNISFIVEQENKLMYEAIKSFYRAKKKNIFIRIINRVWVLLFTKVLVK